MFVNNLGRYLPELIDWLRVRYSVYIPTFWGFYSVPFLMKT